MASVTMVSLLLEAADRLIAERPRSSAFKRRAVSTAYYAVFHALAKVCADSLFQAPRDRSSQEYERVYRALDHGPLKHVFSKEPLKSQGTLQRIGETVVYLQSERVKADYAPPIKNVFSIDEARRIVAKARLTVTAIESLPTADRLILATVLLFKPR